MSEAPKEIWVPEVWCKDLVWMRDPATKEIPYIRADIADDLLEALEFLLTCKHGEFCDHYQEAESKARAAIAKARGPLDV